MRRANRIWGPGIATGVGAGVVFAIVEVIAAVAMGMSPLTPFRMFASVVLGRAALETTAVGSAFIVGLITHLVLSAVFGVIYVALNSGTSLENRASAGRQSAYGLIYGTLLWLVNFQVIARLVYPWFLGTNQIAQWLMHALAYGLPLAVMYALSWRRGVAIPASQRRPRPVT